MKNREKNRDGKGINNKNQYTYDYSGNKKTYQDGRGRTGHRTIVRLVKVIDVILYEDLNLRIIFDNHYELIIVTTIETRPEFIDLENWEYCSPELDVCYTITSQNEVITSKYEE